MKDPEPDYDSAKDDEPENPQTYDVDPSAMINSVKTKISGEYLSERLLRHVQCLHTVTFMAFTLASSVRLVMGGKS